MMLDLRSLLSTLDVEEKADVKVESYRHGYQHGTSDSYDFIERYSTNRLLKNQLLEFIQQRDSEMADLTGKMI